MAVAELAESAGRAGRPRTGPPCLCAPLSWGGPGWAQNAARLGRSRRTAGVAKAFREGVVPRGGTSGESVCRRRVGVAGAGGRLRTVVPPRRHRRPRQRRSQIGGVRRPRVAPPKGGPPTDVRRLPPFGGATRRCRRGVSSRRPPPDPATRPRHPVAVAELAESAGRAGRPRTGPPCLCAPLSWGGPGWAQNAARLGRSRRTAGVAKAFREGVVPRGGTSGESVCRRRVGVAGAGGRLRTVVPPRRHRRPRQRRSQIGGVRRPRVAPPKGGPPTDVRRLPPFGGATRRRRRGVSSRRPPPDPATATGWWSRLAGSADRQSATVTGRPPRRPPSQRPARGSGPAGTGGCGSPGSASGTPPCSGTPPRRPAPRRGGTPAAAW